MYKRKTLAFHSLCSVSVCGLKRLSIIWTPSQSDELLKDSVSAIQLCKNILPALLSNLDWLTHWLYSEQFVCSVMVYRPPAVWLQLFYIYHRHHHARKKNCFHYFPHSHSIHKYTTMSFFRWIVRMHA